MGPEKTSLARLLQLLLDIPGLSDQERTRIQSALYDPSAHDLEELSYEIIEALMERGLLRSQSPSPKGVRRIHDPWNRRVFNLSEWRRPRFRIVDPSTLPRADSSAIHTVSESLIGSLTLSDSNHVEALLDPRNILRRLEGELGRVLGAARCLFKPVQFPMDWMVLLQEDRPDLLWSSLCHDPLPVPGQVYVVPDLSHLSESPPRGAEGSLLIMGLGGSDPSWHGVVEWHSLERDGFPSDRQSLAVLVGRVLQNRLTSSLRLQAVVFRDVLTGVYNRSYFKDQVEKEIRLARRKETSLGLCIIDIDDFKEINHRFGYSGGDKVLRELAHRLRGSLRSSDTLARYGGDEFAALLGPPMSPTEGPMIAERLKEAASGLVLPLETLDHETAEISVTVSIGGAVYPRDGESLSDLWTTANRCLVAAKDGGKDRWSFPKEVGEVKRPRSRRKGEET